MIRVKRLSILLIVGVFVLSAQAAPLRFSHLTINEGLPENSVRAILQDHDGFLWFGTQNGVARYDGTNMAVHLPDPDDPASIGIRFVLAMAEDSSGQIWMGDYASGLSVYDPSSEKFTNYATDGDSLPGPGIATIRESDGSIWVTTGVGRLHRTRGSQFELVEVPVFSRQEAQGFTGLDVTSREIWVGSNEAGVAWKDRENDSWRQLRHLPNDPESLPSDFITFIQRDSQGRVWVGSRAGLALHKGDGKFKVFKPDPLQGDAEVNYLVCIAEDAHGDFWIGSATGLYHFDPDEGAFTLHDHDPDRPDSPVLGPVLSVLVDRSGIVWAGSWHTGLNKYDPGSSKFDVNLNDPEDPGSLDMSSVGSVFEDRRGILWVGTGSRSPGGPRGSLNFRSTPDSPFEHLALPKTEKGRQVNSVYSIVEDGGGALWLGTDAGLWQLDPERTLVKRPAALAIAPSALFMGMVSDMSIDPAGRVWVASWQSGVFRYDPITEKWKSFQADPEIPNSLESNDFTAVSVDDAGRVWAGTDSGGLYLFQPDLDRFTPLEFLSGNLVSVMHIMPAGQGRVLLSTGTGIHLVDTQALLRSYSTRDGLPSDFTGLAVMDSKENIWASTGLGLVRIDAETGEIKVFDERDGLPRNELYFAICRTGDGHLYFGGHHGLVSFHPQQMVSSHFHPPVHITGMMVQDEPLRVGPDSPLTRALTDLDEIRLAHTQNDISLSFAALDYAHPERNRYRFRLEPHETDWRQGSSGNMAHYTNLDPGTYNFQVMGSNSDGEWNEIPVELRIVISPPWYRTNGAVVVYALLLAAFTLGVFRHLIRRERVNLALEMERSEARHLQKLDQMKSHFFANISHEFRTPLTLLMSPLQRLQEDPGSGSPELFDTMARNARRLARLIDQLLDLSRLEADRMPSHWRQGDWGRYLKALASSFSTLAEQRNIVFSTRWPETCEPAWFDPDILDKVLVNLLSNALKFTPQGGEVTLTVSVEDEPGQHPWPGPQDQASSAGAATMLTLSVLNTGSHIPAEELDLVFDRFHQVVENTDFGDLGSGIGLALVKELTDWCHGKANVSSHPETGTEFRIILPLYRQAPPGSQPGLQDSPERRADELEEDLDGHFEDEEMDEVADDLAEDARDDDLPSVLLVEDNADLRNYVRLELQDEFQVLLAPNGKSGIEAARSEIPDLVLCDVMMPEMDGYQLCEILKADDLTSHVPIILLTAKADIASRKQGLQAGADDFVAKPFDLEELRIRIRNLIEQRKLLAQRYAQLEVVRPGRVANPVPTADDRFLNRAREIIVANLDDPEFRVEKLCREVGMSRTQLHRKMKAVSGRSAGEFIRVERLNRAAEMLGRREGNVTEVAYSVGYRSLSQFAKAFREHFGMAPSDFEG
jgi:signal transduction histidine kinase/ligand-binding sensor domain-containing protein/DNA-binding response OmpR family regulator